MDRSSLLALRRKYAGLRESGAKQRGLRHIRDALRWVDRADMRDHVARLTAVAVFELPYAEAAR